MILFRVFSGFVALAALAQGSQSSEARLPWLTPAPCEASQVREPASFMAFLPNDPPVIEPIENQFVQEGETWSYQVIASDSDLDELLYSVVTGGSEVEISQTGLLTWTTHEETPTGTFNISVVVQDGVNGSVSEPFQITLTETNQDPYWDLSGMPEATELVEWSIDLNDYAFDDDVPANSLTFSLGSAPPTASLNAAGVLSWTPAENESGPQTIEVIAHDNASPPSEVSATISLDVAEVNSPPVLNPLGAPGEVNEEELFEFTATANDSDWPENTLTFSLSSAPSGMTIDASTGAVHWTPAEAQGPGEYTFSVHVSDGQATDSEQHTVTVNEVVNENLPPVLDPISSQTVRELKLCTFTVTATDPNPGQQLTYSLEGDVPFSAYIDPSSGVVTFRPLPVECGRVYVVDVVVRDNGNPSLEDRQAITFTALRENRMINRLYSWTADNSIRAIHHNGATDVLDGASMIFAAGQTGFSRFPNLMWRGWGDGATGLLSNGVSGGQFQNPVNIPHLDGFVEVGGGSRVTTSGVIDFRSDYAIALSEDKKVFTWGNVGGLAGQLGRGASPSSAFLQTPHWVWAETVSRGGGQTAVISRPPLVFSTGSNQNGTLGSGTFGAPVALFQHSPGVSNVIQIATGGGFVIVLQWDGRVFQTGYLIHSPSSTPTYQQIASLSGIVKIAASAYLQRSVILALHHDGRLLAIENAQTLASPRLVLTDVVDVAMNDFGHAVALKNDGTVWQLAGTTLGSQIPSMINIERIASSSIGFFAWAYGPPSVRPTVAHVNSQQVAIPHDGDPATSMATVQFVDQGSFDPDGGSVSFAWHRLGAPTNPIATGSPAQVSLPAGIHNMWLEVTDDEGEARTYPFSVKVLPEPNKAPFAQNDSVQIQRNTTREVTVLLNDLDPDGDPLRVLDVNPGIFTVTILPNNKLRITPPTNYVGKSSFTYRVVDPYGVTATATVEVNVFKITMSGWRLPVISSAP